MMNDSIKDKEYITICVPVYGVEKFIEECATSLFEQSYPFIKYIFVNDCTKDRSMDKLAETIAKHPERKADIQIINHETNKGLAAARNTAVSALSTRFFMWVDSDDRLLSDAIQLAVDKQRETNADIVSCNVLSEWANRSEIIKYPHYDSAHQWCLDLIARKIPVFLWGRLIRTSLYMDHKIRAKEGVNMGEDYHVTPRLAYYAENVAIVDKPLYIYNRKNENAYTSNFSQAKADNQFECLQILGDFFQTKGEDYVEALQFGTAKIISEIAMSCCRCGDGDYFKKRIKDALQLMPKKYCTRLTTSYKIAFYLPYYAFLHPYAVVGHYYKSHLKR